jgi:NhaP-type Na+/H+ or K+/H+ antiporter
VLLLKFDYRLILVAVLTVFGNAYVQYLIYKSIDWVNALLVGLVLTAIVPLLFRKKK